MNRQRGAIAAVYLYLLAAVGVAGGLWWLHNTIDEAGYNRGVKETKADYALRDNAALVKANKALKDAEDKVRELERKSAQDLADVAT